MNKNENKEIYRKKFSSPVEPKMVVTEINAEESFLTIWDEVQISYTHHQDVSEYVYIDFEDIPNYADQVKQLGLLTELSVSVVENDGIVLYLYNDLWNRVWIFLACRDCQSWYYDNNLWLDIGYNNNWTSIDLRKHNALFSA